MDNFSYLKYTTGGLFYVYDIETGSIVCVNESLYHTIDDYFRLSSEELTEKYQVVYENLPDIVREIEDLRQSGLFLGLKNRPLAKPTHILDKSELIPLRQFLRENCRSVVLELTQACNLRCKYCCYGEHFSGFRDHGSMTMSIDVAKLAVTQFLERAIPNAGIGFYGGEPLLEFELLRKVVDFLEYQSSKLNKKIQLFITTNGTLLGCVHAKAY